MTRSRSPYSALRGAWLMVLVALCGWLLAACRPAAQEGEEPADRAALLRIERTDSFTKVEILDAWHEGRPLQTYVLVPQAQALPRHLPAGQVVRTPLRRAVCFSSIHAALLYELGCQSQVVGLCDVPYVQHPALLRAVEAGRLADMGSAIRPEAERLAAARPDALLVSSMENRGYGPLQQLGIPIIECEDYMERSALGRAEWMRFFGLLFGCEARADSLFRAVSSRYDSLHTLAAGAARRPTLLCDLKQGNTWYVPGGASYLGRLYADAGADYLFADQAVSGSAALSPEAVFARSREADVWLVKYGAKSDLTYEQLGADDPLYRQLKPWRECRVFGCNTYKTPFYEEVPFHPDLLLRDLIHVFHPELLPGYRPRYFFPLKSEPAGNVSDETPAL